MPPLPLPTSSTQSPRKLLYSLTWAIWVVNNLKRKHPRATETILYWLAISEKQAALFLATGDEVWPQIRFCIKTLDYLITERGFLISKQAYRYIEKVVQGKSWDRLAKRLDESRKRHRIKEQG